MTRKEIICDVAKKQFTCIKDENLKSALQFAFIDGVEWADKHPNLESLWHDASEEPKKYPIIYQDKLSDVWILQFSLKDFVNGWEDFKRIECVTRWAYIKDILLKGGEK